MKAEDLQKAVNAGKGEDIAARCDQPAGEPVPLPIPSTMKFDDGSEFKFYTRFDLREYAETVAAPLRSQAAAYKRMLEQAESDLTAARQRAETAERERDEARRDEARYRFVRDPDNYPDHDWWADILGACDDGQSFDAAIDSAMGDDNGK